MYLTWVRLRHVVGLPSAGFVVTSPHADAGAPIDGSLRSSYFRRSHQFRIGR